MMLRKGPTADVGIAIGKVCFSEVTMVRWASTSTSSSLLKRVMSIEGWLFINIINLILLDASDSTKWAKPANYSMGLQKKLMSQPQLPKRGQELGQSMAFRR